MKEKRLRSVTRLGGSLVLAFSFVMMTLATTVYAQSSSTPSDTEAVQKRILRARAMAAAHNLTAAGFELDAILKSSTDEAVRDVARIMLMGIYLEQADYGRAQNLLEETFKGRVAQNESTVHSYFALAGQSINGARAHLERYRAFGINIADKDLPTEAVNDLDHLRALLERIAEQAREMSSEDAKNTDALALLEDVAGMRGTLARNREERQQWQRESTTARQKLVASETRIASVRASHGSPTPGATTTANPINVASAGDVKPSSPSSSTESDSAQKTASRVPPASHDTTAPQNDSPGGAQTEAAKKDGQPIDVGSLIDRATQRVSPSYPQYARSQGVTGMVRVYLVVDETGAVASIKQTSGPALLQRAAVEAARQWKFRPTMKDGQPVRVVGYINFNFAL